MFSFLKLSSSNKEIYLVKSNVNFREGPSTSYKSYGILKQNTEVLVLEYTNTNWYKVLYDNKVGYISTKYLVKQSSKNKYYTNSEGIRVQSPTYYNSVPAGATALCRDGTYSFSRNRRGTCSHHGGVKKWLK